MTSPVKKAATKAIAEIDHAELTIRMLEIGIGMRRPVGMKGAEALRHARKVTPQPDAYIIDDFEKMAVAAMQYVAECINEMRTVS